MTKVRIVKLDDAIKMEKSPPNTYSVYKNLIDNPEKIKNYIEKKSRKNTDSKFKEQFKSKVVTKKTKKNIRSKIKYKSLGKNVINKIFHKINNEQQIKSVNKVNFLKLFREIIRTNDVSLSNKFIKIINRKQLVLILSFLGVVRTKTQAPTPLLKNLLYNCITSTITIIT
tara:strand:+ start:766 stop:1275 length:510 start_codon:yes stop_codon:yes gene_type:complete